MEDVKLGLDHFKKSKFNWVPGEANRKAHDVDLLGWNSQAEEKVFLCNRNITSSILDGIIV